VTDAGSTGRKLVFWWRSCIQVRHAGGTCGAVRSEGGTPLSRDGALLYSRAPGVVVIRVSWSRSKAVVRFRPCCAWIVNGRDGSYRTYGNIRSWWCGPTVLVCLDTFGLLASRRRADGFLCALSVLRSGRFAFCHGTIGFLDTALCTFWSRSGSIHGAAVERSGTAGGMKRVLPAKVEEGLQCAVGWLLGLGAGGE
jgi:hypothetical protein